MSLKIEKKKMKKGPNLGQSLKKLKKHKSNSKKKSKDLSPKKHKKLESQKSGIGASSNEKNTKKPNLNISLSPKKHKKIKSNQNLTPKLEKGSAKKKVKVDTKILKTDQAAEKLAKLSEQELLELSKKIRNKLEKRKLRKAKNLKKDCEVTPNKGAETEGIEKSDAKASDEVRTVKVASDISTEILKKQLELRQLELKKQALEKLAEIAAKNEVKKPLKPSKQVKRLVGIRGKNKFSNLKNANLEKISKNIGTSSQADQIKERIKEIESRETLSKTAKRKLAKLKASLKLQEGGILNNKEGSNQFAVRVVEQQVPKNDSDIGQNKEEKKIVETQLIIGGKLDSKDEAENVDKTKDKKKRTKKKNKKKNKLEMSDFKVDALKKDGKTKQKKKSKKVQKEEGEITEDTELEELNRLQNDSELKVRKKKKKHLNNIENTPSPLKRKLADNLDDLEIKSKKKKKKHHKEGINESKEKAKKKKKQKVTPDKRKLESQSDIELDFSEKKKRSIIEEETDLSNAEESPQKRQKQDSTELESDKLELKSKKRKKKHHKDKENYLQNVEKTPKKKQQDLLEHQSDDLELQSKKKKQNKGSDSNSVKGTPKKKYERNSPQTQLNELKKSPGKKEQQNQPEEEEEDLTHFVDLELEKIYSNTRNSPKKKKKQIQLIEEGKISSENQSNDSKLEENCLSSLKESPTKKKKQKPDILENELDDSKLQENGPSNLNETPKKKKKQKQGVPENQLDDSNLETIETPKKKKKNKQKQSSEEEKSSPEKQSIKKDSSSEGDKATVIFENEDMELSENSGSDSKESETIAVKEEKPNVSTSENEKNDENKPPMSLTGVGSFINKDLKKISNNSHNQTPKKKRYVLFVGNLAYTATTVDVKKHFLTRVSKVVDVRIPRSRDSNMQRGFGYIEVESQEDFEKALSMHNTFIRGRKIAVQYTTSGSKRALNKAEVVGKNQKLHALRKAGKLAGSHNYNSTRSFRRKVQQGKADKPVATKTEAVKQEN